MDAYGEFLATVRRDINRVSDRDKAARRDGILKLDKALKKRGQSGETGASAASSARVVREKSSRGRPDESTSIDFSVFDIRVGHVRKAWKHPTKDRLFCEQIDLGGDELVTVATGLWGKVTQEEFEDSRVLVVCNLEAKPLDGGAFLSNGMVLAAEASDGKVELLRPPSGVAVGTRVSVPGCLGEPKSKRWMKKKRKKWVKILETDIATNDRCEACFKGIPWEVGGGKVTVKSLVNAPIK